MQEKVGKKARFSWMVGRKCPHAIIAPPRTTSTVTLSVGANHQEGGPTGKEKDEKERISHATKKINGIKEDENQDRSTFFFNTPWWASKRILKTELK